MKKKYILTPLILLGVAAGVYYYLTSNGADPAARYRQQTLEIGDVSQSVSANGTLNPVILVSVGTQVTGIVKKLYVDFNDSVEKDQILMELDDVLFNAQIEQSTGNLRNAEAALEFAVANEKRIRELFTQEYVSALEMDQAVQARKSAQAQVESARGAVRRDKTNLDFSVIRSPVSGVVVDRIVDIGQTVVASFQTPELIRIAEDLSQMVINSSFAEADIGNIKVGQTARFNVDAFPTRNFVGVVKQLRLNPTVTSNVVTYDVVVSVDNPDQTLLPGMTAYVTIETDRKEAVLLAPNSALRYRPSDASAEQSGRLPSGGKPAKEQSGYGSGKLHVLRKENKTVRIEAIPVRTGITDGRFTEIITDALKPGDRVIVSEVQDSANTSSSTMRFRMF